MDQVRHVEGIDDRDLKSAAAVRRRFRQALIVMNRALGQSKLSALQYHLLLELAANGPAGASQVQLAECLAVPEPRISLLVKELVDRGLVRRHRAAPDRRIVRIALTAAGRRALFRASEQQRLRLAELVRSIPPHELASMVDWGSREYLGLRG